MNNRKRRIVTAIGIFFIPLLLSCTTSMRQFYHDIYFQEDNIYENKTIGFCIPFSSKWNIITTPDNMNRHYRAFARTIHNAGGELLFIGTTVEGLYGTKAIAMNLNEPPLDYATYIRHINSTELEHDTIPIPFYTKHLKAVKWIYDKAGYRFVEFFFIVDTYNIRLSFWTKQPLFNNFLPVFEEIMGSVAFTAGF